MWLTLAISGSIFLIIYLWASWNFDYWRKHGIPYVKPTLFFGNLKDLIFLKKNIGEVYWEFYWKYPNEPAVGIFKLGTPQLVLRDIDLIKTASNKEFNNFRNNEITIDKKTNQTAGVNPFMITGDSWKRSRTLHTAILSPNKLRAINPLFSNICRNMVDYLMQHENTPLEVKTLTVPYSTDVLTYWVYGLKTNSFINSKEQFHLKIVKYYSRPTFFNILFMFLNFAPWLSIFFYIKVSTDKMINYLTKMIKDLLENSSKNNENAINFIQIMANEHLKSDRNKLSYEDLAHHSLTYFSGFDSVSTQLGLTLYMLALHPDVQKKLREEIKGTVKKDFDELHKMKYLDAVVNETQRIYPTGMVIRRVCTQDIVLKSDKREYPIKKGMSVAFPFYAIHRDEAYFPQPMKYNPERFYCKEIPPQFVPFGTGPRTCFGAKFALTAIKNAVLHVIENFEILLRENEEPKMPELGVNSLIISSKQPLWLKFKKLK